MKLHCGRQITRSRKTIAVSVLFAIFLNMASAKGQFYYGEGQQIPLNVDSLKILIKFDGAIQPYFQQSIIASIGRIVSKIDDDHSINLFQVYSLFTGVNYDDFLDAVQAIDGISLVEPYYLLDDSAFLAGDQFCVAFSSALPQTKIDSSVGQEACPPDN